MTTDDAQTADGFARGSRMTSTVWRRLLAFYTPQEAAEWLIAQHPQLGGEIPAVLLAQGRDSELHAILDRLDSGGYL